MSAPVKKREYVSPVREARAEATRARIIAAATRLFLEAGYARTSTAAIGKAARTSEASVYAAFGSKADLLVAVVRDHVVRDRDFPLARQPIWTRFAAEHDRASAIAAIAAVIRRAHERSWRLLAVATAAAQDDRVVAEAVRRAASSRRDDCDWFVREVIGIGEADDAGRKADEVWTLTSVENYRHLVVERSWPPERYEAWLAAILMAILR
ncbi:MAG TPA: helix-turn-helix domain-containing protein [Candidatus Limnocylindrales bacterium]